MRIFRICLTTVDGLYCASGESVVSDDVFGEWDELHWYGQWELFECGWEGVESCESVGIQDT